MAGFRFSTFRLFLPLVVVLASCMAVLAQRGSAPSSPAPSNPPAPAPSASSSSSSSNSAPSHSSSSPPSSSYGGSSAAHSSSGGSSVHSSSGGGATAHSNSGGTHSGGYGGTSHSGSNAAGSAAHNQHGSSGNQHSEHSPAQGRATDAGPSRPDRSFHDRNNRSDQSSRPERNQPERFGPVNSSRTDETRGPGANRQPGGHGNGVSNQTSTDHRSRMSQIFLFWKHQKNNTESSGINNRQSPELKKVEHGDLKRPPCKGVNCNKPVCPPGQALGRDGKCGVAPVQSAIETNCGNGAGIGDPACGQTTVYQTGPQCQNILAQIEMLKRQMEALNQQWELQCGGNASTAACLHILDQIEEAQHRLRLLEDEYDACLGSPGRVYP